MLKSLRRKLTLAIVLMVGLVLAGALGSSFYSAWSTQRDITLEALDRALVEDVHSLPRMGEGPEVPEDHENRRANVLIISVDLDEDGLVIDSNDTPIIIDSSLLSKVVEQALAAETDYDWDRDLHVAWRRLHRSDGSWRVVIADTSAIDLSMQALALRYMFILLGATLGIFLIAFLLSRWMVQPVERSWEQQRRFVADASHELKTPLAVIMANTQILERGDTVLPEGRRWVKSTADEAAHMKGLVEELLELARTDEVTAGSKDIKNSDPVDFSSLVENAALEFDAVAFERGCTIEDHVEEGIYVKGDQDWLFRLCKILVDNACKYASEGTAITVKLSREAKRCVFEVNNKGAVIDPEDIPHLFERFYRTDKARSRDSQAGGFGLGLAIAEGICTSHGGTISATSTEADGTTFTATLPILPAKA